MRPIRFTITVLAVSSLLAACGSGTTTDATPTPSTRPTSAIDEAAADPSEDALADTAPDGSRIPDGTWAKTSTTADAKRLGIPRHVYQPFIGQDGELHIELRIEGDDYAQFGDDGGIGALALGDRGTAGYDTEGNWVATSDSDGCPGCVLIMEWSVDGDRLTLTVLDATTIHGPLDVLIGRLVMEGTYARTS